MVRRLGLLLPRLLDWLGADSATMAPQGGSRLMRGGVPPDTDDTVVCEVEGCGQEFPDEFAWQEHWEDTHLGEDDD